MKTVNYAIKLVQNYIVSLTSFQHVQVPPEKERNVGEKVDAEEQPTVGEKVDAEEQPTVGEKVDVEEQPTVGEKVDTDGSKCS